jgi:hypothetical protein
MLKKTAEYKLIDIKPLNLPVLAEYFVNQHIKIAQNVVADVQSEINASNKQAEMVIDSDNTEFDLEAEISKHPDSLFVKCFAIKADEENDNGDFFCRDELFKAVPTFVGCPVFTNHKNDDINEARGKIIHSWWDDARNGIMVIARVDAAAYPQLARGIRDEYIVGTSMGCQVHHSLCSICHNYAETPDQYCFEGSTAIAMSDLTTKRIQDIQIGDMVLDAFGRATKVTHLFKRHVNEKAILLRSRAIATETVCTKNHPFLVKIRGAYTYCPAEYLTDNHTLYTPVPQITQDDSFFAKWGFEGLDENCKKQLCRFVGYYAAEGSRVIRGGKVQAVELTFHKDEWDYVFDVIQICENVFGRKPQVYRNDYTKNTTRIRLWNPKVAQAIHGICPGIVRDKSKRFDSSVFTLSEPYLRQLFSAAIDGDGYCDSNSSIVFVSASPSLASQFFYMSLMLGMSPAFGKYANGRNLETDKTYEAYRLHIGNSQIQPFRDFGNKLACATQKATKTSKLTNAFDTDGMVKHALITNDQIDYDGDVYNIETESHSYVANNTSVHNCTHIRERKTRVLSAKKVKCEFHKHGPKGESCPICGSEKLGEKSFDVIEKKAFEHNYGIKFIENSFVVNPACHDCGVTEVIDPIKFRRKVAEIVISLPRLLKAAGRENILCDDKKCYKIAGQKQLQDLQSAINLLVSVSQDMLKQKDQIDLEFLSDLVAVLSDLQDVTDELNQQGYGRLPEPGQTDNEGAQPGQVAPEEAAPAPVNPTPGGGSKVQSGAAGTAGTVTGPSASQIINLEKLAEIVVGKKQIDLSTSIFDPKINIHLGSVVKQPKRLL